MIENSPVDIRNLNLLKFAVLRFFFSARLREGRLDDATCPSTHAELCSWYNSLINFQCLDSFSFQSAHATGFHYPDIKFLMSH